MPAIHTAVIGYGLGGRTFHVPLVASVPGLEMTAVVSSQADLVRREWPQVRVCASVDEVLTDERITLVVISTPNVTHADLATRSLLAGKHVVVDKPFTVTAAEARAVASLADEHGRMLSVFHNRRWDADFLTLRRLLGEGALGDVLYFESHYDRFRPLVRDRWRERDEPGAGTWYDLGAHLVDEVLQLMGSPIAVSADLMAQRPTAVATDYFHVVLHYPAGRRAVLHGSSLAASSDLRFVVHGTAGSYVKRGIDSQEDALKHGVTPGAAGWGVDPVEGRITTIDSRGAARDQGVPNERGDYRTYYAAVRDSILTGSPPPVPAADGIAVMTVVEAAIESAASGQTMHLERRR